MATPQPLISFLTKGNIALRQEGESLIQFDDVQFNQQKLGYIEIHADLTKPQKLAIGYIRPTCTTNCLAVLKFSSYLQKVRSIFLVKFSVNTVVSVT